MYLPIFNSINKNVSDRFTLAQKFIETWHEIEIEDFISPDFDQLKINIPSGVKLLTELVFRLYSSSILTKNQNRFNAYDYIFYDRRFIFRFDETLDALLLFKDPKKEFYHGIKLDNLKSNDPFVSVFYEEGKKIFKEYNIAQTLSHFILSHLLYYPQKPKTKSYP